MLSNHFAMQHRPAVSRRVRAAKISMRIACGLLLRPAATMLVSCLTLSCELVTILQITYKWLTRHVPKLSGIYCSHIEVFSHQVAPQPVRNTALRDHVEQVNKDEDEHAGHLLQAGILS